MDLGQAFDLIRGQVRDALLHCCASPGLVDLMFASSLELQVSRAAWTASSHYQYETWGGTELH